MARRTRRQAEAEAAEYARTVPTTPVLPADLRAGMITVRPDGARYLIVTVGEDSRGILAQSIRSWERRGVATAGALVLTELRIDTWGLPGADAERLLQAWFGPTHLVINPATADTPVPVETSSIS